MGKKSLSALAFAFIIFLVVGQKLHLFGSSQPDSFPKQPDKPSFIVSNEFDGQWFGRRINTTGNSMCEPTTITGTIHQGKALFQLTYNGTALQGWVAENGELRLYASHRQWDYRFSATLNKDKLQGKWYLTNGPCRGTWSMTRG